MPNVFRVGEVSKLPIRQVTISLKAHKIRHISKLPIRQVTVVYAVYSSFKRF